jgi:hypothetical protein
MNHPTLFTNGRWELPPAARTGAHAMSQGRTLVPEGESGFVRRLALADPPERGWVRIEARR